MPTLLYGFEFFEGLAALVFPCRKAICVTTVYYSSGCTWAGKLNIFGKLEMICLGGQGALIFKFFPHI